MGWEGAGQRLPPGSHWYRNRKPRPAGIYSNSSAPDHTVLSVVHLFWGQALKSLLPESAPGRPAWPLLSQRSPGVREPDPGAGLEVPESGRLPAGPHPGADQAPGSFRGAPSRKLQEQRGRGRPARPPLPSLTFLFLPRLPQPTFLATRPPLSPFLITRQQKEEVDSSKPPGGLDEQAQSQARVPQFPRASAGLCEQLQC